MRSADKILIGSEVHGCGVSDGTKIVGQFRGPSGGPGMYIIEPMQTVDNATLEARAPE